MHMGVRKQPESFFLCVGNIGLVEVHKLVAKWTPALNIREIMCKNDATVQIQVLGYIPIHKVESSQSDELMPNTPNLL